ncbi:MAG: 50S ribosomal protein L11 methyltransferase [Gammaproteobacteria bacterium]|nr:50S ribosomal protein L11 methyltransferase [Gammaproteobacteria bacterium]MDH3534746.1 50S ribosomal protein L11 methyltransferase [Gammaproteobacteria bacterium]
MAWWQFSLDCRASELEQVEHLMQELGASSISLCDAADEPIYEPLPGTTPVWENSVLTATFGAESDPEILYRRIAGALPDRVVASIRRHRLEDEDWEQAYKRHFKPIQCAPGLWIVPSWAQPPDPGATVINLDPGLAFGTGSHPTTALCLAWLAAHDVSGLRVIDYGCGSGILAIAACKLGAHEVVALDIDAQALRACAANIDANGIDAGRVRICLPEAMEQHPADLLIANILAGPLIELAPRLAGLVKAGGRILLSGILNSQLEDIQLRYRPYFDLDPARSIEDWACIGGKRV